MTHCPDCNRLRRPVGMHICVPGVRGRTVAAPAPAGHVTGPAPIRINRITLPGDGPAARVWNALVLGER